MIYRTKNGSPVLYSGGASTNSGDSIPESLIRGTVGWTGKNVLPITLDMMKAINTIQI